MHTFVVTASLKPGASAQVGEILREGPPFELSETSLERHQVFLGDGELVFLFEGVHAEVEARRLFGTTGVLDRVRRLAPHLATPPRFPVEGFGWERPHDLDGVVFASDPGPGDSDGGAVA